MPLSILIMLVQLPPGDGVEWIALSIAGDSEKGNRNLRMRMFNPGRIHISDLVKIEGQGIKAFINIDDRSEPSSGISPSSFAFVT